MAGLDTVMCANVLEHVEDDELAVRNLLSSLEAGGRLLLYLPAHQALFGVMDELAGHYRRYDQNDLRRIAGGEPIVQWAFVNPIAAVGWWFNRTARYASLNETSINTLDRCSGYAVSACSRSGRAFASPTRYIR